jgi:adenosine deaminase
MMNAPTNNRVESTLDHLGQLKLLLQREGGRLRGQIDLSALQDPASIACHFKNGFAQQVAEERHFLTLHGETVLTFEAADISPLVFTLYGEPVYSETADMRLTVTELRLLALSDVPPLHVPAPRDLWAGFDPALHAPITELHTHSSGQIDAASLMEMALAHGLDYPTELLDRLRIAYDVAGVKKKGGYGFRFSPLEAEGLACEVENKPCDVIPLTVLSEAAREQLMRQFCIPQDVAICFSDFDREFYRFVNPLVKHPALAQDLILAIARACQRNGIRYCELSTASMLNLDAHGEAGWFAAMIRAVAQAEAEMGVVLRFLVGVPRTFGPAKVMAEIAKTKFAARHPYIAGIDLLGYEANKTSDFAAALAHIADWARAYDGSELKPVDGWDFKRDFTIRIHAGETGKHHGNVAEAVNIAKRFGIRVRIAHALNEEADTALDTTIRELSSQEPPLVSMEFCPDSNIAYNNIQDLHEIPFARWLSCCHSWFLGSDGAGAIQTTPVQLALSALAAGVTLDQLVMMRAKEEAFIADQMQRFAAKQRAYRSLYPQDAAFLAQMVSHIRAIQAMTNPDPIRPLLPEPFHGKIPILVAGASHESLEEVDSATQQKIREAVRLLVDALDPAHVYFVVGRTKHEGVTGMLDDALMAHNTRQPMNKFEVLALTTEDTTDLAHAISWVVPQAGTREKVPDNLISFMASSPVRGVCIFIGGKNFTADMILKCRRSKELPYLLMANVAGASRNFARRALPQQCFTDASGLLQHIATLLPGALH